MNTSFFALLLLAISAIISTDACCCYRKGGGPCGCGTGSNSTDGSGGSGGGGGLCGDSGPVIVEPHCDSVYYDCLRRITGSESIFEENCVPSNCNIKKEADYKACGKLKYTAETTCNKAYFASAFWKPKGQACYNFMQACFGTCDSLYGGKACTSDDTSTCTDMSKDNYICYYSSP